MSNQNDGQNLSEEEIKERREENARATEEAHKLARERQQQDIESGVKPTASTVAESIKAKLQREEFSVFTDENGNQVPPARDAA